jgi:hypothetical protein
MGRFSGLWMVKGYLRVLKTSAIISISWVALRDESRLLVFVLVLLAVAVAGSVDVAHSVA